MSSQLKLKDLVQDNIEKGDTSEEEIHKAIAAVPFEVLEEIEPLESEAKSTLKIHEETKMRTDGQTLRGNEMIIPHVSLESAKEWAKATFTSERMAKAGLVAATMVVTGYLGSVLAKGIETYSMSGF